MLKVLLFQLLSVFGAALLACLPETALARGSAGTVGTPLRTCITRAAPGMTAATLFRNAAGSSAGFDCTIRQQALGAGDFWLISQSFRADGWNRRLVARSLSQWQRRITLHALYADGRIVSRTTDGHAATRNLQLGAIIQRSLPHHRSPLVRLLWHVEGSSHLRGVLLAPTLATEQQAAMSNTILSGVYAGFAGMCLALLLYNIGLARALRHAFLPFYCLMMVGLLLYVFSSSGALAWTFPWIENSTRLRTNYLTLALTGVAALAFLRHFFEARVITPALRCMVLVASMMVALPAIGITAFAPLGLWWMDLVYSLGFIAVICAIVPILVNARRQRSEFLWLFVVAWGIPVASAVARSAFSFSLIRYSFWVDNSTILTMAVEALLSSMAISYRIILIARERDEAREQEIAARLLADTDPLTGLLNRRAFLRHAIGREGEQVLMVLDIDNFKRINDTIGHDGGDEVLRLVARSLRTGAQEHALIARIGGEEFAIVAPASRAAGAEAILAELRAARMPFDLAVTASIGVCVGALARESDWKAMYASADRALFDAKAAGRDRVRSAAAPRYEAAA